MNANQTIAIFAATLITAAGMIGIARYTNAIANSARPAAATSAAAPIKTLPAVEVRPTPEQLRELQDGKGARSGAAPTVSIDATMPYYSFAADYAGA